MYVCERKYLAKFLRYFHINIYIEIYTREYKRSNSPNAKEWTQFVLRSASHCKGFAPYETFYPVVLL